MRIRHPAVWAVFFLLLLLSAAALAQEGSDLEARIQFDQGVMLYEEGKFAQAAVAFKRAYELKPSYKLWWNIAQVENELGHYSEALNAYTHYLEEGEGHVSQDRVDLVNEQIDRLRYRVGELAVECPINGATVYVDGRDRGLTPLKADLYVDIGEHEVEVRKAGKQLHREVVAVAGQQQVTVWVQVEATEALPPGVGPEPEPEPEPAPAEPAKDGGPRIWTWVALGVGAAAGVTGGILGAKALSRKNSFMDDCGDGQCYTSPECGSGWFYMSTADGGTCREDDRDKIKNMALVADIMYGVAAAAVATGVVLFFIEPGLGQSDEVAIVPTITEDGSGLVLTGEF
jgi:hypothetical protein